MPVEVLNGQSKPELGSSLGWSLVDRHCGSVWRWQVNQAVSLTLPLNAALFAFSSADYEPHSGGGKWK